MCQVAGVGLENHKNMAVLVTIDHQPRFAALMPEGHKRLDALHSRVPMNWQAREANKGQEVGETAVSHCVEEQLQPVVEGSDTSPTIVGSLVAGVRSSQ